MGERRGRGGCTGKSGATSEEFLSVFECIEVPFHPFRNETSGITHGGDGWPQDALRHTYGSMRNAQIRNLPQVAEEMGTSETMLRRHYHNPKTKEEAVEWFRLRPEMIRYDLIKRGRIARCKKTGKSLSLDSVGLASFEVPEGGAGNRTRTCTPFDTRT